MDRHDRRKQEATSRDCKHVTDDDVRDIQFAVHAIAQEWLRRGYCPGCLVREIVHGTTAIAQDVLRAPAEAVHEMVEEAYSTEAHHHMHGRH
jgi:hypothetical protein